jgi:hypothetical protein
VISLTAIPLSLLAAALVLSRSGGTLDTMVIAGLIIALGEVVDDAIIDVENSSRRLRLNRVAANPRRAFDVVLDASLEVRSAVVYGSVIVVLVFLPVFFLEGLAGSFFRPLALAYVLAISASLFVALTVTPALSLLLLPQSKHQGDAPLVAWLKARYRRTLPGLVAAPRQALVIVAISLMVTAAAYPFLGEEFLPHFKEYDFLMHWVETPGTSLEVGGRRLPGSAAGSAHLSSRANQGSADRRERHDRRPDLRARAGRAAADGGCSRQSHRRCSGCGGREGTGPDARAAGRSRLRPGSRPAARGHPGGRARDGSDNVARGESR